MGWPRKAFLNVAAVAGGLTLLTGATAIAAPEFIDGVSEGFEEVASEASSTLGTSFAGAISTFTSIEPATLIMTGTAALAYGVLVPKEA